MLSGYKTYIWAICSLIFAVGGWYTGNFDTAHAADIVVASGFVVTIRSTLNRVLPAALAPLVGVVFDMAAERFKGEDAVPVNNGSVPQPK